MQKKNRFAFVYLIVGVAFLFGWSYIQNPIWPPPVKQQKAKDEEVLAFAAGGPAIAAHELNVPSLIEAER